jgi:hypothetical protein
LITLSCHTSDAAPTTLSTWFPTRFALRLLHLARLDRIMNRYTLKFLLVLCAFLQLCRCSLPIFSIALVLNAGCSIYTEFVSVTRLAHVYAVLAIPYFLVPIFAYILDVLRSWLSTFQIPWLRILVLEGVALALFMYSHVRSFTGHAVCTCHFKSFLRN